MNFWDQTHPLAADSDRLYEKLVPSHGMCNTLQGETIRASSKIGYDWYNNGWGCNNWSGAVVYLMRYAMELAQNRTNEERAAFIQALSAVRWYSHGESCDIDDDEADKLCTTIQAFVVQNILDNPQPRPNTINMWSLSEPDAKSRGAWGDGPEDDD